MGTGSSWSRLTHTKDILLDMTCLNKFITPEPMSRTNNANKENVEIEVEAGMRVVDFVEQLDTKYGLALDMMGNYAGQTVGGVANTSTHGSGIFSGTLVRLFIIILNGDDKHSGCREKQILMLNILVSSQVLYIVEAFFDDP